MVDVVWMVVSVMVNRRISVVVMMVVMMIAVVVITVMTRVVRGQPPTVMTPQMTAAMVMGLQRTAFNLHYSKRKRSTIYDDL